MNAALSALLPVTQSGFQMGVWTLLYALGHESIHELIQLFRNASA